MFLPLTSVMKFRASLLFLFLTGALANGHSQSGPNRYPNELADFRFYATAKWKSLEPLVSTVAEVRKALGNPTHAVDLSQYFEPYPGDDRSKNPVFTYDVDDAWEALVYLGHSCFADVAPKSLRLCTIELVPKKRVSFGSVQFPSAFKKNHVAGADAAWDEFADGSGLSYHVYTTRTPYGNKQPGDLNRIVYGPSDDTLARYATKSP
jgi:hypothetical protein